LPEVGALAFKCLLGDLAVLAIALLSGTKSFFIAGLMPLFPRSPWSLRATAFNLDCGY
jgi:uncharacterized membrane protein (GlpM family)